MIIMDVSEVVTTLKWFFSQFGKSATFGVDGIALVVERQQLHRHHQHLQQPLPMLLHQCCFHYLVYHQCCFCIGDGFLHLDYFYPSQVTCCLFQWPVPLQLLYTLEPKCQHLNPRQLCQLTPSYIAIFLLSCHNP